MSTFALVPDVPRIPVGDRLQEAFDWLNNNLGPFFDAIDTGGGGAVDWLIGVLEAPDPVVFALLFALIGLLLRGWEFAVVAFVGLLFIIGVEQWAAAMQTLALVLVATVIALVIAIPLGILAARSRWASNVIKPVLDMMQTMPAFVWLVPVVTLFSIGVVPGVVATIIFALPPGVRLTELGIRGVDGEIVEASNSFGATPQQTLFGVQLPLAMPTIMAGINQVIMLALSMAVIAGLVGAEGLGGQVTGAIATLNLGLGFEAGLSVVILAIYLDRVTASVSGGHGLARRLLSRRSRTAVQEDTEADDAVDRGVKTTTIGG
ncbi:MULTISPECIES: proline/glycine betaine ABC transporter permease [unclassified Pseudonocardia]|uniref:ABC transporter permease n=1 Tax=unclassified Pseudonocardia TaxID=2619320 RepID=UPI0009EB14E1|nr:MULTISPECIES: proline/glycine betaine ABC transporter permease [unclassified Pseudonocardia]